MAIPSATVSDLQKSYLVSIGASPLDCMSTLERNFFGATATETLVDAKKRYHMANHGGVYTDTLATLDRKHFTAVLGSLAAYETNQDAEYRMYKGLAP